MSLAQMCARLLAVVLAHNVRAVGEVVREVAERDIAANARSSPRNRSCQPRSEQRMRAEDPHQSRMVLKYPTTWSALSGYGPLLLERALSRGRVSTRARTVGVTRGSLVEAVDEVLLADEVRVGRDGLDELWDASRQSCTALGVAHRAQRTSFVTRRFWLDGAAAPGVLSFTTALMNACTLRLGPEDAGVSSGQVEPNRQASCAKKSL